MKKISIILLLYPYPWFSERLKHKDVFQFPLALAKALGVPLIIKRGTLITGEELEGQSSLILRLALALNSLITLLQLVSLRIFNKQHTPCVVFFHIGWPTALLACAVRSLWGKKAQIVVKTDLNPSSKLALIGGGSRLERLSIIILRRISDIITGETKATENILRTIFHPPVRVIQCRNGIDISSLPTGPSPSRTTDILVVSRFTVAKKGVALYAKVIPLLANRGITIHLVGEGSKAFVSQTIISSLSNVKYSENLSHTSVLNLMRHTHIFLSLSQSESFLIAIAEAYAMGCHVISTPVGVAPDLALETTNVQITSFEPDQIVEHILSTLALPPPQSPTLLGGWNEVIEKSGLISLLRT